MTVHFGKFVLGLLELIRAIDFSSVEVKTLDLNLVSQSATKLTFEFYQ